MRIKLFQIRLTEKEDKMLEMLGEFYGDVTKSEALRRCLGEGFNKAFPAYKRGTQAARKELETKLTPEELCERAGGVVTEKEGIPVCAIKVSESMTRFIPLSKPELLESIKK